MSILAAIPGGSALSERSLGVGFAIADYENYVDKLVDNLTDPQHEIWE